LFHPKNSNHATIQFIKVIIFLMSVVEMCQSTSYGQASTTISPDSVRITYEMQGDGTTTLVFVHGWSCDRTYWKGQVAPFSRNYKVVAIDLAGHGESAFGRKHWTMEAFGEDVASVVKALDLKKVIMIGHSMGSVVIAEAARHLPGRVAGLVMVDQYKNLGPGMTREEVELLATRLRIHFTDSVRAFVRRMFLPGADSSLAEWVATDMSSAPPAVALEAFENTLNYSRRMPQTLSELKLPVIAINDNRRATDLQSMKQYGVEVMVMSGVGHFLMMEDPGKFNELLETAIKKIMK
jgi:pimeloyl-ACP methyl ester carboxylesterase